MYNYKSIFLFFINLYIKIYLMFYVMGYSILQYITNKKVIALKNQSHNLKIKRLTLLKFLRF